jgi:hypothetical protein
VTALSPEARKRAKEIAEAAPPFSPVIRDQIYLILWGTSAPNSTQADSITDAADAA